MLTAEVYCLSEVDLAPECAEVLERMRSKFDPSTVDTRIPIDDWARWSLVLQWVKGATSILDIGTAHGTFINSLALARAAERIVGVDIRDYSLYSELYPGFERLMVDAEELPFADNEFDTVTCMEVIEHLPDGKMERVIESLRRVAARRLIISVPFCEGLPLYKGHAQRFTPERITRLFPDASYTLLVKQKKGGVPWLIIDECR